MAIDKIGSSAIGTDVITAEDLANNSITVAEITDGAVTDAKIADDAVTENKILDGAVTESKLASTLDLSSKNITMPVFETQGIKFPGTQVPSADPNTLDDYEEGTWTPQVYKGTTEITSPTAVFGGYIKIGKLVWINFYFYKSSGSATGSDPWYVSTPLTVGYYGLVYGSSYQSIRASYTGINTTNYQSDGYDHRWQANASDKLELYGQAQTVSWTGGYLEFSGTGVLQTI